MPDLPLAPSLLLLGDWKGYLPAGGAVSDSDEDGGGETAVVMVVWEGGSVVGNDLVAVADVHCHEAAQELL